MGLLDFIRALYIPSSVKCIYGHPPFWGVYTYIGSAAILLNHFALDVSLYSNNLTIISVHLIRGSSLVPNIYMSIVPKFKLGSCVSIVFQKCRFKLILKDIVTKK